MSAAGVVSVLIALGWALQGLWVVLPFAVLELFGLGIAFLLYSRHATDQDRIVIGASSVSAELFDGGKRFRKEWSLKRAQVMYQAGKGKAQLIELGDSGSVGSVSKVANDFVKIGRFVPEADRRRLADELATDILKARLALKA